MSRLCRYFYVQIILPPHGKYLPLRKLRLMLKLLLLILQGEIFKFSQEYMTMTYLCVLDFDTTMSKRCRR